MRDPELVARAQRAAARLELAWERWRALQGLGEAPAQPVVGYVGYALKEPWGQPRAVIGFSAEEAERLAEFLERGSGGHGTINHSAVEVGGGTPRRSTRSHRAPDRSRELAQRHAPEQPATQLPDILAVTSQLSGSQHRHSFLSGSGARLEITRARRTGGSWHRRLGSGRPGPGPNPDSRTYYAALVQAHEGRISFSR